MLFNRLTMFCTGIMLFPMLTASLAAQVTDNGQSWPQFRGPAGNGHSVATDLPSELTDASCQIRKTELPGRGWSSPVIVGDEIWLTTAIEIEATGEEREKKLESASIGGMSAFSSVELKAICVDRSGVVQKTIDLFTVEDPPLIHSLNSFASPTPVVDDRNVYFHFGTFGTAAVERSSGDVIWKNQDYQLDHETGPGSSPILHNGLLIFHCDGCDLQFATALNASTGKEVWRTKRSGKLHENPMCKKAFCTPVIILREDGSEQLLSPAANWIYGYDPQTGDELWKLSYGQLGFSNVARPIIMDQLVYVCSCYSQSKMMAIDFSGSEPIGDSNVKWSYNKQVPNMPSPIEIDGAIYFTSDRGILTCLDGETGEVHWNGRLGGGFSSSPLYADGKIYFGNHDGQLFVLTPNKGELDLLATNELDSQIMASPAAVGNALYVRTEKSLYQFTKK